MTSSTDLYRLRERPVMSGRSMSDATAERFRPFIDRAHATVTAPYTGITTNGTPRPHLFPLQRTGRSTQPIGDAASVRLSCAVNRGSVGRCRCREPRATGWAR